MGNNDKFLKLYREYETLLRDAGMEYKDIEDGADDLTQNRLRISRQMRNYLTHNSDTGFLEVSDRQVAFLDGLVRTQKMSGDVLRKHLKTVKTGACMEADKAEEVLAKFVKLGVTEMPVYEVTDGKPKVLYMVSLYDTVKFYLLQARPKTAKISGMRSVIKKLSTAPPYMLMEDVAEKYKDGPVCCTDDGTKDGKFLGVYYG